MQEPEEEPTSYENALAKLKELEWLFSDEESLLNRIKHRELLAERLEEWAEEVRADRRSLLYRVYGVKRASQILNLEMAEKSNPDPLPQNIQPILHTFPVSSSEYNPNAQWKDKIIFALKWKDRPMRSTQIRDTLEELEPRLKMVSNLDNVVSVYCSKMFKAGRIHRQKVPGERKYYFAHPFWVDENGVLREDYLRRMVGY